MHIIEGGEIATKINNDKIISKLDYGVGNTKLSCTKF